MVKDLLYWWKSMLPSLSMSQNDRNVSFFSLYMSARDVFYISSPGCRKYSYDYSSDSTDSQEVSEFKDLFPLKIMWWWWWPIYTALSLCDDCQASISDGNKLLTTSTTRKVRSRSILLTNRSLFLCIYIFCDDQSIKYSCVFVPWPRWVLVIIWWWPR